MLTKSKQIGQLVSWFTKCLIYGSSMFYLWFLVICFKAFGGLKVLGPSLHPGAASFNCPAKWSWIFHLSWDTMILFSIGIGYFKYLIILFSTYHRYRILYFTYYCILSDFP